MVRSVLCLMFDICKHDFCKKALFDFDETLGCLLELLIAECKILTLTLVLTKFNQKNDILGLFSKFVSLAFRSESIYSKGKGLDTCYSTTYMSQTRDQQLFTVLEVAADWHLPMVPSVLCGHPLPVLTDSWTHGAASRHTIAPISDPVVVATTHFPSRKSVRIVCAAIYDEYFGHIVFAIGSKMWEEIDRYGVGIQLPICVLRLTDGATSYTCWFILTAWFPRPVWHFFTDRHKTDNNGACSNLITCRLVW